MAAKRTTVEAARRLRRSMTLPEVMLWNWLRTRPALLRFRRQHPVGRYVLDFYCASAKLAIEVDGAVHGMGDNAERDMVRDAWLRRQGYVILRLRAADVFGDFDAVARAVMDACERG